MKISDLELADAIRAAFLAAARSAYEDAGLQGLCGQGRWEAAIGAVQALDLRAVAQQAKGDGYSPPAHFGSR